MVNAPLPRRRKGRLHWRAGDHGERAFTPIFAGYGRWIVPVGLGVWRNCREFESNPDCSNFLKKRASFASKLDKNRGARRTAVSGLAARVTSNAAKNSRGDSRG